MIYKVGILGASGKMGVEIAGLLAAGFTLNGDTLEFSDAVSQSKKLSSIEGVPVRTLAEKDFEPVHVWIDFSSPKATLSLLEKINTPVVIGTTGFTDLEKTKISEYAKKQAVLLSSNMSPGMNAVFELLRSVPLKENDGFDVVLDETHHKHKKDSPSGTAKSLLEILKSNGFSNVQVNVARVGGVKGVHKVSFVSDDEEFSIEHRAFNRTVFARGALIAAQFLAKQKPGLYSMRDIWKS